MTALRTLRTGGASLAAALFLAGCEPAPQPIDPESHRADVEAWRAGRYAQLTEPFGAEGWLALVGLYWLEDGENSFGTAPQNDVIFPAGSGPARIGTFALDSGGVTMRVAPGLAVSHDGHPVQTLDMTPDTDGTPTMAHMQSLQWHVIRRGERFGIRLKDSTSVVRLEFSGIDHFPVDRAWRFNARFDRYDPPKTIRVPNILGTVGEQPSPGAVVFEIGRSTYRLDVTGEPDAEKFFVTFGDSTNGFDTYGGGRYVWVDAPDERGRMVIDFNKAYNPPCVFTDYATCPLPPHQNRLSLRMEAGEREYHGPSH